MLQMVDRRTDQVQFCTLCFEELIMGQRIFINRYLKSTVDEWCLSFLTPFINNDILQQDMQFVVRF